MALVIPPLVDSVPLPSVTELSLNVTVPVGVPLPLPLTATMAVKVTDWPNLDGLIEELAAVAVEAWLTVWVTFPPLEAKLESPE